MRSWNFNEDFWESCKALGEEDGKDLMWALASLAHDGMEPDFDQLSAGVRAAYVMARGRVLAARSGSTRANPAHNPAEDPDEGMPQTLTRGYGKPCPQKEKEKEKYLEKKKEKEKKRPRKFVAPTVEEVRAHCAERGYTFDPEAFVAFYESKGWKVGRNPMRSWHAACVTWQKRAAEDSKPKGRQVVDYGDVYSRL